MENVRRIVLRAGQHLSKEETLSLRRTKALRITQYQLPEKDIPKTTEELLKMISVDSKEVVTWSSIVRNAITMLNKSIIYVNSNINTADEFIGIFNKSLQDICDNMSFKLNANCPKRLYRVEEEDDLINSVVYKSNKNHLIDIITDENGVTWYLCAVYTQEIVVMLEALLDTIYYMADDYTQYRGKVSEFPQTIFVIEYVERENNQLDGEHNIVDDVRLCGGAELHRFNNNAGVPYSAIYVNGEEKCSCPREKEAGMISWWNELNSDSEELNINKEVENIDNEIQKLSMTKDLYTLQRKVGKLSTSLLELYADIQAIVEKYELPSIDEILGNK